MPTVRVATPFATGHILADAAFRLQEQLDGKGFDIEVATSVLNEQTINPQMTHLTLTSHLVGFGLVMANECFLSSLNNGRRMRLLREIEDAVAFATDKMFGTEATQLTNLQSLGMTVVTPDAAAIRTAAEPAINNLFATKWTVTTWAEVLGF